MSEPSPPLRAKVLAGLVWSVVRNWGSRLMSLLTFMVLARFVSPTEVGLLAAAMIVLAFAELFVEQGFVSAIVQRPEITPGQVGAAFVLNLALAGAAFLLILVLTPAIARAMRIDALTQILPVAALVVPLHALGFCQLAMSQRHFAYKAIAVRTLAAQAAAGVLAIVLVLLGYGVWALVAQALATAALTSLLLWLKPQWRPTRRPDFTGLKPIIAYSAQVLGSHVLNYGNTQIVQILLAASMGPAPLGLYLVGVRIYQTLMQLFSSAVMQVAHSGFARLAADPPRLRSAYRRAVAGTAIIALPAFTLSAVAAPELVVLLFGPTWLPSAAVMVPMALLGAVQSVQFFNGSVLDAIGKPSLTLLINIAKLIATVIVLLASRGQSLPVIAWAFVAGQLTVTPLSYGLARRHAGISLRETAGTIAPVALGCVAMVVAGQALRAWPAFDALPLLVRATLQIVAAVAVCAVACFVGARDSISALRDLRKRR
jgi:O-antigen/teichoic acid export membrane protein